MSLHGYNMQDAVIMNRSSVQRALGRSTFNRTYNAERRRFPGGQVEEIEIPGTGLEEVKGLKPVSSYDHLEADGLPHPEKYLEGGDVLVGRPALQILGRNWCRSVLARQNAVNHRCLSDMEKRDGLTMYMSLSL